MSRRDGPIGAWHEVPVEDMIKNNKTTLNPCRLKMKHRVIETNGIKMHLAEQGEGPLVVLCHGFPELWYSWRHQLAALAEAGYHAVAPDQRGYGQTDRPEAIEDYHVFELTADVVGLVQALGKEQAVIVGHDWGAAVAWHSALLRPDLFSALVLLSVPYLQRSWADPRPTEHMKQLAGEGHFYQLYFQEPGKAEAELEADVRKSMRMLLYSASGDARLEKRWRFLFDKSERFLDTGVIPELLPAWLTEVDLDFFVSEFERTGFRGGLNWYRNIDALWELTPFLSGAEISQPSLFIAGELDAVISMYQPAFEGLEQTMPGLKKKVLLSGAGHWIQQERPAEVNELLLQFLAGLSS
jgi:pimeloyl-ACP methyl ester carboxylesterase